MTLSLPTEDDKNIVKWLSEGAETACSAVLDAVAGRLGDDSRRLERALDEARSRAWKTLEIALAGDSFWERCKSTLARGEDRALAKSVRALLLTLSVEQFAVPKEELRRQCLGELRAARKAGLLDADGREARALTEEAVAFARFDDPQDALRAERQAVAEMAGTLQAVGHTNLARLLTAGKETPLLVLAVRYFFRRSVEEDEKLARALTFVQMEGLQTGQEQGFAALLQFLDRHGQRFDLLSGTVRPGDSLSIRGEAERRLVKDLVARYRALSPEQRGELPALLNAVGRLEVAVGSFQAAEQDFTRVAELVREPSAQAEAHHNAYRAALELRDWERV